MRSSIISTYFYLSTLNFSQQTTQNYWWTKVRIQKILKERYVNIWIVLLPIWQKRTNLFFRKCKTPNLSASPLSLGQSFIWTCCWPSWMASIAKHGTNGFCGSTVQKIIIVRNVSNLTLMAYYGIHRWVTVQLDYVLLKRNSA